MNKGKGKGKNKGGKGKPSNGKGKDGKANGKGKVEREMCSATYANSSDIHHGTVRVRLNQLICSTNTDISSSNSSRLIAA